jgi:hypothetical protein
MSVPFCFAQNASFPRRTSGESGNLMLKNYKEQDFLTPSFIYPLLRGRRGGGTALEQLKLTSLQDTLTSDTTVKKPKFKKFRMKRSPWLAVGLSAVLPGAGQFYNGSYWKVPVILGLAGYLGYQYYDTDKKYRDFRDQYSASQTSENPGGDANLKFYREFYFNQRNDFVWYFVIVYVVNLVDAYIDAHLFDFTVKEDKIERFGTVDKEYKLNVRFNF